MMTSTARMRLFTVVLVPTARSGLVSMVVARTVAAVPNGFPARREGEAAGATLRQHLRDATVRSIQRLDSGLYEPGGRAAADIGGDEDVGTELADPAGDGASARVIFAGQRIAFEFELAGRRVPKGEKRGIAIRNVKLASVGVGVSARNADFHDSFSRVDGIRSCQR